MNIEITLSAASTRHPAQWQALCSRLGAPPMSAAYDVAFHKWHEDTHRRPCADLPKQLLSVVANIKSLKLVAKDATGLAKRISLDLASLMTSTPSSQWPLELAGQDPALRASRRAAWPLVTVARMGRPEREVWQLAGLVTRTHRNQTIEVAQFIKDEKGALLIEDPANPQRLLDHDLTIEGFNLFSPFMTPASVDPVWERVGRAFPAYLFGHVFVDPFEDVFNAKAHGKQWTWHAATSPVVLAWIARHLQPSGSGFSLVLEDASRLDVRDYRDDQTNKPRIVLRAT